jgi:hypothetical protein
LTLRFGLLPQIAQISTDFWRFASFFFTTNCTNWHKFLTLRFGLLPQIAQISTDFGASLLFFLPQIAQIVTNF